MILGARDRAADVKPSVITLLVENLPGLVGSQVVRLIPTGLEALRLEKAEDASVVFGTTRLRDDIDDPTGRLAVLRLKPSCLDLDFFDIAGVDSNTKGP